MTTHILQTLQIMGAAIGLLVVLGLCIYLPIRLLPNTWGDVLAGVLSLAVLFGIVFLAVSL